MSQTYKEFIMINEMAKEISMFQKVRSAITKAKTKEAFEVACKLFIEYQKSYGDDELGKRLERIHKEECTSEDIEFVVNRARKKMVKVYNWYNKKRDTPKDIRESAMISVSD